MFRMINNKPDSADIRINQRDRMFNSCFLQLYGFFNHSYTPVKSQHSAVQAEIVAVCGSPVPACVVIIVAGSALVIFPDPVTRLVVAQVIQAGNSFDTKLRICMDKDAEQVRILRESIVRTPPDDDTRAFLRYFFNGVVLRQKYLLAERHFA